MGKKIVCICEQCGDEGEYNPNWDMPNRWFDVKIKQDGVNILNWSGMYCSTKCITKMLENQTPSKH